MIRWPQLPGKHPLRGPAVLAVFAAFAIGWGLYESDRAFITIGVIGLISAAISFMSHAVIGANDSTPDDTHTQDPPAH
ncbi:hypothetical protein AYO38_10530 [bacterium SCGC AG-212-C10]|nr:hypothetical protein AYO38_10530 [bacterium SCGC AG-212-C10]